MNNRTQNPQKEVVGQKQDTPPVASADDLVKLALAELDQVSGGPLGPPIKK